MVESEVTSRSFLNWRGCLILGSFLEVVHYTLSQSVSDWGGIPDELSLIRRVTSYQGSKLEDTY